MMKRIFTILIFAAACSATMIAAETRLAERQVNEQSAVAVNQASVMPQNHAIVIRNNDSGSNTFNIYCVTGQLIKSVHLTGDAVASIEIPKGFYVVKCNNDWSRKVIVK